jgi:MscS family membrane protein
LLASITKMLAQRPKLETGALPVRFVGVGTYSLDIEIYVHVLTRNGDEFMQIQQELYLWILDAVEAAGTSLALPTQASIEYASIDPSKPDDAPEQRKKYQLTGPSGKENANGH